MSFIRFQLLGFCRVFVNNRRSKHLFFKKINLHMGGEKSRHLGIFLHNVPESKHFFGTNRQL